MDHELRDLERDATAEPSDIDRAQRYDQALLRAGRSGEVAGRFRFKFQCPLRYQQLTPTDEPDVRACDRCQRTVHYCRSIEALSEAVAAGRCVAFRRSEVGEPFLELCAVPGLHSAHQPDRPCVVHSELESLPHGSLTPHPLMRWSFPLALARELQVVPLRHDPDGVLLLARSASFSPEESIGLPRATQALRERIGTPVRFVLVGARAFAEALAAFVAQHEEPDDVLVGDLFGDV
ncbi:MAG: hypothetical protein AB7N76_11500 [Planctomycetota bacterium]